MNLISVMVMFHLKEKAQTFMNYEEPTQEQAQCSTAL